MLSPEELFRLATGFVDLSAWMSAEKQGLSRANRQPSLDRRYRRRLCRKNGAADLATCTVSSSSSSSSSFMCHAPNPSVVQVSKDQTPVMQMSPSPLSTSAAGTWTCPASRTPRGALMISPQDSELTTTTTTRLRSSYSSSSPAPASSSVSSSPRRSTTLRSSLWPSTLTFFIMAALLFRIGDCCSSRSTPKPRPPPPPSPLPSGSSNHRPNITFQTYACPPAYAAWYCLNGATCFTVKIAESILYNCECTDGYVGQRCEFKDLEGSYLPLREKIMLEKASIAGGATVAVVLVVILSIIFYTYMRQRRKDKRFNNMIDTRLERIETHRLHQQRTAMNRTSNCPVFTLQTPHTSPTHAGPSPYHIGPGSIREMALATASNAPTGKRNEGEELRTVGTTTVVPPLG